MGKETGKKANARREDIRCSNDPLHSKRQTNLQPKAMTPRSMTRSPPTNMTVGGRRLWVKNVLCPQCLPPRSDLPAQQASKDSVRSQGSLLHGASGASCLPQALNLAECARLACTHHTNFEAWLACCTACPRPIHNLRQEPQKLQVLCCPWRSVFALLDVGRH